MKNLIVNSGEIVGLRGMNRRGQRRTRSFRSVHGGLFFFDLKEKRMWTVGADGSLFRTSDKGRTITLFNRFRRVAA